MDNPYRTKQGDVLDALCFKYYGDESHFDAVLDANAGLENYPDILPMGVTITFPVQAKAPATVSEVRLWS